jgi:TetR/AcrR family transcriptional repressor of bet genes
VPRKADHAQRRRQIIEAVWRITARGGLGAASFREVAADAGVSVRLVQYYFGTKADLMRAANDAVAARMGSRVARALLELGVDAPPRDLVDAVIGEFLPTDRESGDAMRLFYAFFTAQLTDSSRARVASRGIPNDLVAFLRRQIERAQERGETSKDVDPQFEAMILMSALPAIASGVLAKFVTLEDARAALDYALDRLFTTT